MILKNWEKHRKPPSGGERRDKILEAFEDQRDGHVLRGRRALLKALLQDGTATCDVVYDAVRLPSDIDPRCLGGVPGPLCRAGIIRKHAKRYVPSSRPQRNASPVSLWELADREAAERWLIEHPDKVDTPDEKGPTVAAVGPSV